MGSKIAIVCGEKGFHLSCISKILQWSWDRPKRIQYRCWESNRIWIYMFETKRGAGSLSFT